MTQKTTMSLGVRGGGECGGLLVYQSTWKGNVVRDVVHVILVG